MDLKIAIAAALLLSVSCGFSSQTARPTFTPSYSCPSPSQAQLSVVQPAEIAATSQDVMNHLTYSIKRSQSQASAGRSGEVLLKVQCGQNYAFADGGSNKTYTITSDHDRSTNCPKATCWVIHVVSVSDSSNMPSVSDIWVDRATLRWLTRHRIDKNIVSAGDMSTETTDRAVFE